MKILIIKPSSFGDIIQANPVLSALKMNYPGAEITWLVFRAWESVVNLFPEIDGKIVWDRQGGPGEYFRVLSLVRKGRFDVVVDLQGLARTAAIARFSGAKKVIGVPGLKEFSTILIREVFPESKNMNAVLRNLETARYLTGKTFEPVFNLRVPGSASGEARKILEQNNIGQAESYVAFIPAARGTAKTWPAEYYDDLAEQLFKHYGTKIVALGAEGDGKKLSNPEITDITGRTSIQMLAAILAASKAVIGGDTGPVHLAAALGAPVVAIFGGSDIRETAPMGANVRLVSRFLDCSPCRGRPSCGNTPCLMGIRPEEVFKTITELLKI